MSPLYRLRAVHASLALLVIVSYVSGEWGPIHSWLGYGALSVIGVRLALAFSGLPQLGLSRFYPQFAGLNLDNALTHPAVSRTLLFAIAFLLLGTVATGIGLDGGRVFGLGDQADAGAIAGEAGLGEGEQESKGDGEEGAMEEAHETFANLLMLLVGAHVTYLLAFKRPLAKFMLFLSGGGRAAPG